MTRDTVSGQQFAENMRVRIRSTGEAGIIVEALPNRQYRVFISESDEPIVAAEDLDLVTGQLGFVEPRQFLSDLLLFKLRKPLSDVLYSYSMSRTNLEHYQFKPAVKFLRNPSSRILIADEVGLGKTIEACIIYLELKARMQGDLPRVLIVCPAALSEKWQSELILRFGEEFDILDRRRMREFLERYEHGTARTMLRAICSLESLRHPELLGRIVEVQSQFDLVIVDEAHHMRNPETLSHGLGETLSEYADSLVLLTATPVQLQSTDLFYILHILDAGQFESADVFEYLVEPNTLLNRTIRDLSATPPDVKSALGRILSARGHFGSNPFFDESVDLIRQILSSGREEESRALLVKAIRSLHRLNPFSLVFNRTRRSDVPPENRSR